MKIAYFSPLNPLRSGISDYSEELLPALSKKLEIDLFVSGFDPKNPYILENYNVYSLSSFDQEIYQQYDEVIYHIGNHNAYHKDIYLKALEFPGIVVLHDYSIHHLVASLTVAEGDWEAYIREMHYNYGSDGEKFARLAAEGKAKYMWETDKTLEYPANRRLLETSKGVIVHSRLAEEGVVRVKGDQFVQYAPIFTEDVALVNEDQKEQLRKKYLLPLDCLIFSSFGLASSEKRIHSVLKALSELKKQNDKFMYLIVGEEAQGYELKKMIKELGLEKNCRQTGHVSLDEFKEYIMLSDSCVNLRYPTQGESSASLLRILGYGKPAIVSNIGSFSEFPDDFTLKVSFEDEKKEVEDLIEVMGALMKNQDLIVKMGERAFHYIKQNHTVNHTADCYFAAIEKLQNLTAFQGEARFYYKYLDRHANSLRDILSLSGENRERFVQYFSKLF